MMGFDLFDLLFALILMYALILMACVPIWLAYTIINKSYEKMVCLFFSFLGRKNQEETAKNCILFINSFAFGVLVTIFIPWSFILINFNFLKNDLGTNERLEIAGKTFGVIYAYIGWALFLFWIWFQHV